LNLWTNTSFSWTKERHGGAGNIGLSDGSIQTITSTALQAAFQSAQQGFQPTGTATNRLVIP
jgi:prepilin-type processing-associated H-X9-DG protein